MEFITKSYKESWRSPGVLEESPGGECGPGKGVEMGPRWWGDMLSLRDQWDMSGG